MQRGSCIGSRNGMELRWKDLRYLVRAKVHTTVDFARAVRLVIVVSQGVIWLWEWKGEFESKLYFGLD